MTSVYAVGQRLELSLKKRIVPIFGQMEGCWKKICVFSIPQAFSAVLLDAGHRLELSGTAVLRLSTKLLSWQVGEIARFMLDPSSHHLAPFFLWIWNFKHWSTSPPFRHIQARGVQTTPRAWLFLLNSLKQAELAAYLSVLSPLSREAITSPKNRFFNAGTRSFSLPSSTQVQRPISGLTPSK